MTDDETFQVSYALSLTAGILILAGGFVRSFLWAAMGWENGLMGVGCSAVLGELGHLA
jgi:hypothetical protein